MARKKIQVSNKYNGNFDREGKFGLEHELSSLSYPRYLIPDMVLLECGDCECTNITGFTSRYPEVNRLAPIGTRKSGFTRQDIIKVFDYTEKESIFGALPQVRRTVQALDAKFADRNIILRRQCLPILIGDNYDNIIKEYDGIRNRYFTSDTEAEANIDIEKKIVDKIMHTGKSGKHPNKAGQKSICIFGFPPGDSMAEMKKILSWAGIKVDAMFLPNLQGIKKIITADLCVFIRSEAYGDFYGYLINKYGVKHKFVDPPYGLNGVKTFIAGICSGLGVEIRSNKEYLKYLDCFQREIGRFKKGFNKFTLLLLINSGEIDYYIKPDKFYCSMPLLDLIGELGCKLNIGILCDDSGFELYKRSIKKKIGNFDKNYLKNVKFTKCTDQLMLDLLIMDANVDCVYSNLNMDGRVAAAGKTYFSVHMIKTGLRGFCGFAERLERKCGNIFFENYQKFNDSDKLQPIEFGIRVYDK